MSEPPVWTKRSLVAQAFGKIDPLTRAVVPPIHVATTYIRDPDNSYSSGYIYGRPDNATVREAEAVIAMLEDAAGGALLFGSGMAAAVALFLSLAPGDHVVASRVMYWALRNWLAGEGARFGLAVDFVETNDLDSLRKAVVPGRTKLVWVVGPTPLAVEVATKGKDKRKTTVQTPRGENITAVNGATGWLGGGPRPPREMSVAESDAARLDAAILSGTDPRSMFQEFKVVGPETIEGKDTIKVIGRNPGKPPTQLWFDTQSGLLVRMVKFAETPLGRNPTQLDIADYREADGVKNPYRWTVARPGSSFTIQIDTAQQNAAIDDAVFVKPQ